MALNTNPFKLSPWYKRIYYIARNTIKNIYYHLKYPENVWYGGGLTRESALSSVGKGWSELINNIYDAKPKKTRITTVKEKYASLHVYTMNSPEWFEDLLIYYDHLSETICEQCGKSGKVRLDRGWYLTLCDECDRLDKERWSEK